MSVLHSIVNALLFKGQFAVLVYFLAVNGWYLILLVSSLLELRRHMLLIADESRHLLLSSTLSPTISILAPAYNEEATIEGACARCWRCTIPSSRSSSSTTARRTKPSRC